MSRVDEALKRARELATAPPVAEHHREGPRPVPELRTLDVYQSEEERAPKTPSPSVPPPAARHAERQLHLAKVQPRVGRAYEGKLVTGASVSAVSVEQYRRLAAALHHLQGEQGLNRLMVSSAVPQEGKTLTVANLALTLSASYGRRVLVIDADLRRPSLHTVFDIANDGGLCEALQSESAAPRCIQVSSNLWVLPAGTSMADPMASLASDRMVRLIDDLAPQFDWVLLDAPPVALMADAGLLVRLTRAVVLVIAAGATPYTVVEKVVGELGREHIVGTVLNRVDDDATKWSPYYSNVYTERES